MKTGDRGLDSCRDVNNYQPPQGPKHITETGKGLRGGENFGNCGSQGRASLSVPDRGNVTDLNTDKTRTGGSQRG